MTRPITDAVEFSARLPLVIEFEVYPAARDVGIQMPYAEIRRVTLDGDDIMHRLEDAQIDAIYDYVDAYVAENY